MTAGLRPKPCDNIFLYFLPPPQQGWGEGLNFHRKEVGEPANCSMLIQFSSQAMTSLKQGLVWKVLQTLQQMASHSGCRLLTGSGSSHDCICPESCLLAPLLQHSFLSMSESLECCQAWTFGAAADIQGRLPMPWLVDSWPWDIPGGFCIVPLTTPIARAGQHGHSNARSSGSP